MKILHKYFKTKTNDPLALHGWKDETEFYIYNYNIPYVRDEANTRLLWRSLSEQRQQWPQPMLV